MPKLPDNATPTRTCPDRYYCIEISNSSDAGKCAYLSAGPADREEIQRRCLSHKFAEEMAIELDSSSKAKKATTKI